MVSFDYANQQYSDCINVENIDPNLDSDGDGISDRIIFSKTFGSGLSGGEDVDGHGTHVSGIIASSDSTYEGVAPGADIITLKVFDSPGGSTEDALSWVVKNVEKYSIDAVNMSLGFQHAYDGGFSQVFFQNEDKVKKGATLPLTGFEIIIFRVDAQIP